MTHLSFVLIINEKFVNTIISNNQMYDPSVISFVLIINEKCVNNIISNNQMYDTFVICINN